MEATVCQSALIASPLGKSASRKMCSHYGKGCPFRGIGCGSKAEVSCFEAERRTKIIDSPCPVMLKLGYTDKKMLECSMPLFRVLIPDGYPCHNEYDLCVPGLVKEEAAIKELSKKNPDYKLVRRAIIENLKK
jgi:hypothetical protein